ncbi:U5 small nuclear ribonucleoprotein 200 kDa helicase, partial [Trifolium medium]|nr:U5 small nuclear ribonucleoprotein 200 kDa helicase [Trifolium medium]
DQLVSIGKLITDFQEAEDVDGGFDSFEDDVGVAVEFEENEEDDDEWSDFDVVQEEEEEEDDIGEDSGAMQIGGGM